MNDNGPSWRIDELSRRVLIAAKWPATALVSTQFIPTPHLDELERSLEIHLSPHANDGSTDQSVTTGQSGSSGKNSGDVWTWTPQVDNIENTYVQTISTSSFQVRNECGPSRQHCGKTNIRDDLELSAIAVKQNYCSTICKLRSRRLSCLADISSNCILFHY